MDREAKRGGGGGDVEVGGKVSRVVTCIKTNAGFLAMTSLVRKSFSKI
jgi:hypothetical protein